jgi:glycine/D-amino acid oxidase-like deaminating enzyme
MIACHLAARGQRVLLVEKQPDLLRRASFANQARLGPGYSTDLSSPLPARWRAERFHQEFRHCLWHDRPALYAVGRSHPKLTARQFHAYYRQLGIPIEEAPDTCRRMFDPAHIEAVFRARDTIVDVDLLRREIWRRLEASGVQVALSSQVHQVQATRGGRLRVRLDTDGAERVMEVPQVFNCAYTQINRLLQRSRLQPIPLRYELMELALVDVPGHLRTQGVTILSGPCFSLIPFPTTTHHSLSHVRFSPHASWTELGRGQPSPDEILAEVSTQTGFERMRREASRYMPMLGELQYQRSLWEVKAAPDGGQEGCAFFWPHAGLPHFHAALGTRLEAIYDILEAVDRVLPGRSVAIAA